MKIQKYYLHNLKIQLNYFNRKKVYNYYVNTSNLLRNGYIYTKNYI